MTAIVRSEKQMSPHRRVMAGVSPGRRSGKTAGGHVMDRADLKKAITLCRNCVMKFDRIRAGYTTKKNLPSVRGTCDGCQEYHGGMTLLVHESLANTL